MVRTFQDLLSAHVWPTLITCPNHSSIPPRYPLRDQGLSKPPVQSSYTSLKIRDIKPYAKWQMTLRVDVVRRTPGRGLEICGGGTGNRGVGGRCFRLPKVSIRCRWLQVLILLLCIGSTLRAASHLHVHLLPNYKFLLNG
jgi:hypothetical protein